MSKLTIFLSMFFLILFFVFIYVFSNITEIYNIPPFVDDICPDGSINNTCSAIKPYFCQEWILVENAKICGCSKNTTIANEKCVSQFQTEPKKIQLNYTLRGENYGIDYMVYEGMAEHLSEIPRFIKFNGNQTSRLDFKLRNINQEEQKEFLFPLVAEIGKITKDEDDRMRIAVSVVQNIAWGKSNKTTSFRKTEVQYSRYPYEVLYDIEGVCGEKSELLAFLLKEMGYGVAIFYNQEENHEAVGVKCSLEKSWKNSGYCFIETSGVAIISDSNIEYSGGFSLDSEPEIMKISDGKSLPEDLYEYEDAEKLKEARKAVQGEDFFFNPKKLVTFKKLEKKYGLAKEYQAG